MIIHLGIIPDQITKIALRKLQKKEIQKNVKKDLKLLKKYYKGLTCY